MIDSEKITKQIAGTMAIEGMQLSDKELALIRECARGQNHHRSQLKCLQKAYCNLRSTNSLYMFSLCASVHLRIRVAKLCTYSHALLLAAYYRVTP